jgi:hypothetical protein
MSPTKKLKYSQPSNGPAATDSTLFLAGALFDDSFCLSAWPPCLAIQKRAEKYPFSLPFKFSLGWPRSPLLRTLSKFLGQKHNARDAAEHDHAQHDDNVARFSVRVNSKVPENARIKSQPNKQKHRVSA